jgi:hypothetical protein
MVEVVTSIQTPPRALHPSVHMKNLLRLGGRYKHLTVVTSLPKCQNPVFDSKISAGGFATAPLPEPFSCSAACSQLDGGDLRGLPTSGSQTMEPRRHVLQGVRTSFRVLGGYRRCWGGCGPSLRSTRLRGGAHPDLSKNIFSGTPKCRPVSPKIIWSAGVLQVDPPSPNVVNHDGSLGPFGVLDGSLPFSQDPRISGVFSLFSHA